MFRDKSQSPFSSKNNLINSIRKKENLIVDLSDSKNLHQNIYSNSNCTETESDVNMAITISQTKMLIAKDMLPDYSGGSKGLAYFIKQVDTYLSYLRLPDPWR